MATLSEKLTSLSKTSLTNPSKVDVAGQAMEQLVLAIADKMTEEEQVEVIQGLKRTDALSKLQALYEVYETNLENTFVEEFMHSDMTSIDSYRMYNRFVKLIQNEVDLGHIGKTDKVAFIGSGPLPITAILLNKLSGCNVDCYEHYLPAAEVSRLFIDRLGLENSISVIHQPGQRIDAGPYSAVVVALLAKPKNLILEQLAETMSQDTAVICRTSDGIRQVFYETTLRTDTSTLSIVGKKPAHGNETISSVQLA